MFYFFIFYHSWKSKPSCRGFVFFSFPFVNLAFSHFALKLFFISKLICRKSKIFTLLFFPSPYVTNACLMAHADVICVKIGFDCCTQIDVKQEHSLPYLKVAFNFLLLKSLKFVRWKFPCIIILQMLYFKGFYLLFLNGANLNILKLFCGWTIA